MDKLERAFELIRRGIEPEKVRKVLKLSEYEFEIVQIAQQFKELKRVSLTGSQRKEIYERIRRKLPSSYAYRLRLRFVLGFASLLIIASTVIGLAAYQSDPESPLYEVKNAINKFILQISLNKEVTEEKLLERQIGEYRKAIEKAERENRIHSAKRLKKKLEEKKALIKKKREVEADRKKVKERNRQIIMPPKKDEPRKKIMHETTIPEIKEPTGQPQSNSETPGTSSNNQCVQNERKENFRETSGRNRKEKKD